MATSEKEELKLKVIMDLYHAATRNMEFCKRQQWQVVYYYIAIVGALFYLGRDLTKGDKIPSACFWECATPWWLIDVLVIIATVFSIAFTVLLQTSICSERKKNDKIQRRLPLLDALADTDTKDDSLVFYWLNQQNILCACKEGIPKRSKKNVKQHCAVVVIVIVQFITVGSYIYFRCPF